MIDWTASARRLAGMASARARQRIDWPGLAGIALMATAGGIAISSLSDRNWVIGLDRSGSEPGQGLGALAEEGPRPIDVVGQRTLQLPSGSDVPALLKLMEGIVRGNSLALPAAEFQFKPAAATEPARVDIRCTLKGPYPQLRAAIAQLLTTVPGMTLRELNMSRPASDAAEVEAKLLLAILLSDASAAAASSAKAGL